MFHPIYKMTSAETKFYLNADSSRFQELLNLGFDSDIKLCVRFWTPPGIPFDHSKSKSCFVVAHELSKDHEALFTTDWVQARVECIIAIMRSDKSLSQMLPSTIVSQIIYLHSTSQFPLLNQILRQLQEQVKKNPREYQRFEAMVKKYESLHQQALQESGDGDMDDDFDEDEFKTMIYRPNNILPLEKLRLSEEVRNAVQLLSKKYQNRKELVAEGLPWGNRILLAGPPGNGKTALAGALAKLLKLPMFFVNMGEMRRSHIGETGNNINTLFQGLKHSSLINDNKIVIFFDECDSVATTRIYEHGADKEDSASLNVLLTCLDQMDSETIVIAATNYPDELDPAFKRRFSSYLWLAPPSPDDIQSFVTDYQKEHKIIFNKKERDQIRALCGQSWAKVTEFCQSIHTARIIGASFDLHHTNWSGKEAEKNRIIGFHANRST